MPRRIVAILTTSTPRPMYVSSITNRDDVIDNNILATMTGKPEEAHNFESISEAKKVIKRLHNPYERVYVAKLLLISVHSPGSPVRDQLA